MQTMDTNTRTTNPFFLQNEDSLFLYYTQKKSLRTGLSWFHYKDRALYR